MLFRKRENEDSCKEVGLEQVMDSSDFGAKSFFGVRVANIGHIKNHLVRLHSYFCLEYNVLDLNKIIMVSPELMYVQDPDNSTFM